MTQMPRHKCNLNSPDKMIILELTHLRHSFPLLTYHVQILIPSVHHNNRPIVAINYKIFAELVKWSLNSLVKGLSRRGETVFKLTFLEGFIS